MLESNFNWMCVAIDLAKKAAQQSEVPVGAVLVHNNQIIGQGWNQPIERCDPSAHAEIIALRDAAQRIKNYRLLDSVLYVTLEPCAMCMGAMIQARIKHLVFGAWDARAGAVSSVFKIADEAKLNHRISWQGGVMEQPCAELLKDFFKQRRL